MTTQYLQKAVSALQSLNLLPPSIDDQPIARVVSTLAELDEPKALAVAQVLTRASLFNQVVREQISGMDIANRHEVIIKSFDSIRQDAKSMAGMMEAGRLSLGDRMQLGWMNIARGSLPSRFEKIRGTYLDVSRATEQQLTRENLVLTAYQDFRMAMKDAEIQAQELFKKAQTALDEKAAVVKTAQDCVAAFPADGDAAERARLEMSRDEAIRARTEEDKRYQVAKDMADNLRVGYSTAELVFARLQQSVDVKDRIFKQAITFFATNEVVFTGLNANFNANQGLAEATQTLDAMKAGISQGLEDLAEGGNKVLEAGVRAGYGSTVKAESVKKLVDAVVGWQESSLGLIADMRKDATQNALDIQNYVEDGKQRFAKLVQAQ